MLELKGFALGTMPHPPGQSTDSVIAVKFMVRHVYLGFLSLFQQGCDPAVILSAVCGSGSCGDAAGRTSLDLTGPGAGVVGVRNDHPRALLDEVCIMGRFLSLKDESLWHEEENFQPISPPDYPTTYSSLTACCVS